MAPVSARLKGSFVIVDPQCGYQRSNLVYSKEQTCACQEAEMAQKNIDRKDPDILQNNPPISWESL
jgi:hypothetical protein